MPESREIRDQSEYYCAQFFNITFVLKSTDYYEKSLDRDNDLLLRVAKRGRGEKRKEGSIEGRKGGGEGERKNVNMMGA